MYHISRAIKLFLNLNCVIYIYIYIYIKKIEAPPVSTVFHINIFYLYFFNKKIINKLLINYLIVGRSFKLIRTQYHNMRLDFKINKLIKKPIFLPQKQTR